MNKKITRTLGSYGEVNPEFMQYEFAFRKACDIVIKYDFESEICTIHRFSMDLIFIEEAAGDYDRLFNEFIQKYIVEEDRLAVKKVLALENVVSRYKDGEEEQVVLLDKPMKGVYIPKMIWKDMYDFSEDSVLLVLASTHYSEKEYVRDYDSYVSEACAYK